MATKEPNVFEKMKINTQMVAIDTEISVLTDQVVAAKRAFGVATFDLMADAAANQPKISEEYEATFKKVQPRIAKIQAKLDDKRALKQKLKPSAEL